MNPVVRSLDRPDELKRPAPDVGVVRRKLAPLAILAAMNVGVWAGALAFGSLLLVLVAGAFTLVSGRFAFRLLAI